MCVCVCVCVLYVLSPFIHDALRGKEIMKRNGLMILAQPMLISCNAFPVSVLDVEDTDEELTTSLECANAQALTSLPEPGIQLLS